jgi:hypothetical protein
MPYFEFTEASRVLALVTEGSNNRFDRERDCFVTTNSCGEEEIWHGQAVSVLGNVQLKLYGVGAGAWTWEEVLKTS